MNSLSNLLDFNARARVIMNSSAQSGDRRAVVIGAGIVGVCCGLYLQREGWRVTLLDPSAPGENCSAGNAGIIVGGAVAPLANPGIFRELPRLLTDPYSPLAIRWGYLPWILPWLIRFARASTASQVETGTLALTSLTRLIPDSYGPLVASAGAQGLMRHNGQLFVYQNRAALDRARPGFELRRRHGSHIVELGPDELRQIEPNLASGLAGGWHRSDGSHLVDPKGFTKSLAADFQRQGGEILAVRAQGLVFSGDKLTGIGTEAGIVAADAAVVAAGAWSRRFAAEIGLKVPLDTERGYSITLPHSGLALRLPVSSGEGGFFMTPMDFGLRLAGTVEFGGLNAPPDARRVDAILTRARQLLPALNDAGGVSWMGFRPSFPDSLPIIAEAKTRRGVYLAFGHGHLGMSLGGVTGRLIAELASGKQPSVDLTPFRADRF
jgi:D-amino-acid dehydrogenase